MTDIEWAVTVAAEKYGQAGLRRLVMQGSVLSPPAWGWTDEEEE